MMHFFNFQSSLRHMATKISPNHYNVRNAIEMTVDDRHANVILALTHPQDMQTPFSCLNFALFVQQKMSQSMSTLGNIFQPTPSSLISLMDIGQMSLRQVASLTSSISALQNCQIRVSPN